MAKLRVLAQAVKPMLSAMYDKQVKREEVFVAGLERPAAEQPAAGAEAPINLLVAGSGAATGQPESHSSGLIVFARISPDRRSVTVESLADEFWCKHREGAQNLPVFVNAVEWQLGTRLDHVVTIEFEGLKVLAEALEVELEPANLFTLEFEDTRTARRRRQEHQLAFLEALFAKVRDGELMSSPAKLLKVGKSLKNSVVVDRSLDFATTTTIARQLRRIKSDRVHILRTEV